MNKESRARYNQNVKTVHFSFKSIKLPFELVNIILDYDGRIKYKYKTKNSIDYHKFVNVIHKHDKRYSIVSPIIDKKVNIVKDAEISSNKSGFIIQVSFYKQPCMQLSYEYNMSVPNNFSISYVNMKEARAIISSDIIKINYN